MENKHKVTLGIAGFFIFVLLLIFAVIPFFTRDTYNVAGVATKIDAKTDEPIAPKQEAPRVAHVPIPKEVKAIYMSSCVAGTKHFRDDLVAQIERTELNAVIIDIKDYTGLLSFTPRDPELASFLSDRCFAPDMEAFIKTLHEKNIYVIGRITAFQDPHYAKLHPEIAVKRASDGGLWVDRKGINYLDPGAKAAWDHLIKIGKESYAIGFDELNYDYIRFPSDGNMKDIYFPYSKDESKQIVIERFFKYLHDELKPTGVMLSADLFGFTTTNPDDLNIGQILERALPYFDFIAPMIYPSHYPPGFLGYANPAEHPYEVIKYALDGAVKRTIATSSRFDIIGSTQIASTSPQLYTKPAYDKNKIRPWLQDFNLGATYTPAMVRAQIQATYDSGLNSWMIWAPSNRYKEAGALLPAN
ncbi:hypothetical protein H0W32_03390 [Patescibacteria group bacterium]|nr:hypothetical protein [Patescibacteria group bacterium]